MKSIFKSLFFCLLLLCFYRIAFSQVNNITRITTGVGVGFNDGKAETGLGVLYSVGFEKSYGKNGKFRLQPNLLLGGFSSASIEDVRDQFYTTAAIELNAHYDIIRYKSISIVTTGGAFTNYSRGYIGTGGEAQNANETQFFDTIYLGVKASLGFRVAPTGRSLSLELRPFNIQYGNKQFLTTYAMLIVGIKIK